MEVVVTRQVMVLISTLIPSLKLAASLTVTALLAQERHGMPRAQQIYGGSDVTAPSTVSSWLPREQG